jgi:hypothetical protein
MYVCYVCIYISICKLSLWTVPTVHSTTAQILVPPADTKTQSIQHATSCLLWSFSAVSVILRPFRSCMSVDSKIMFGAVGWQCLQSEVSRRGKHKLVVGQPACRVTTAMEPSRSLHSHFIAVTASCVLNCKCFHVLHYALQSPLTHTCTHCYV